MKPKTYTTLPDYIWEKGRVKGAPYIKVILKSDYDEIMKELIEKLEFLSRRLRDMAMYDSEEKLNDLLEELKQ